MTTIAHHVPDDLNQRGDHSQERGILRFERIRVQRQEVIVGDRRPLICRLKDTLLLLAGSTGALAVSDDGATTWRQIDRPVPVTDAGGLIALGAIGDAVLAAVHAVTGIEILRSNDAGRSWQVHGRIELESNHRDDQGRFLVVTHEQVLLFTSRHTFSCDDGGRTWSLHARWPAGWRTVRPTIAPDGTLAAAVLIEDDGVRNTFVTRSTDMGKTWDTPSCVTRLGEVPGDLHRLPDGRWVLVYGQETNPYGTRAIVSDDSGRTWSPKVFVLSVGRYGGPGSKPRPVRTKPASSAACVVLDDGAIVCAFDRAETVRPSDEAGSQPAIGVLRWTPQGFNRPPLCYPHLWTTKVDKHGYLDNGLVRMRPDDRFEGGDFIEPYEMMVYQRHDAEQSHFPDVGTKGAVVCRHPDGRLVMTSRSPVIYQSTDEGRSWQKTAECVRAGKHPTTFGFGVTRKGTLLVSYSDFADEKGYIARSEDHGQTWQQIRIDPDPYPYMGHGDSSRIVELSDGTIIMSSAGAWVGPMESSYCGDVILRSSDDGKTWGDPTVLPPGSCESNFIELPSGVLLCATRYQRDNFPADLFQVRSAPRVEPGTQPQRLGPEPGTWDPPSNNQVGFGRFKNEAVLFSHDGGYNWTTPTLVTRLHEVSADVVLLPDSRIVMTYDQKDGVAGSRAIVSDDGGQTWQRQIYVLHWGQAGRTSSVVLKDERILTLIAGTEGGTRATIWSPQ